MANVWVIEDNTLFRNTVRNLIEHDDGLICTGMFSSAEDAIQSLDDGELPDLVLSDIGLPGMDGINGVREIRRRVPAVPVVMLTVHRDDDKIFDAICAGAAGYLLKTTTAVEIVAAAKSALSGGSPIDAQIARRVLDMFAKLSTPAVDYGLTKRERQILEQLTEGLTLQSVAEKLFVSRHTIDGHVRNIYAKLEVHTRSGAVAKALRERLV